MIHTTPFFFRQAGLVIALFFASMSLFAQGLMTHVPQNALFVTEMHLDRMNKKVNLDSLGSLPFVSQINKGAPEFLTDPGKYGIDAKKKVVVFYGMERDLTYFGILIPVDNMDRLSKISEGMDGKYMVEASNNYFSIKEKNNFFGEEQIKAFGAFNESFLLIFNGNQSSSSLYNQDMSREEREDRRNNAFQYEQDAINAQIKRIMEMGTSGSIINNPFYKYQNTDEGEVNVWMNSAAGLSNYQQVLGGNPMFKGIYNQLKGLTDDSYVFGSISMDEGEMVMDFKTQTSPKLEELTKEINKARINKRFYRYVKQENLMGYSSLAFNSYNAGESYREIITPLLDSLPNVPPGMGSSLFDVLDIFIDEEAIAELIPGNLMFAVSGLSSFETEYTTYIYNDSTFESEEVIRTKTETFPEFTFMLSTDDEENMENILEAIAKVPMGRKSSLMANQGLYYTIPQVKKNLGMDVFLTVRNDILFITNNSDLMKPAYDKGYDRKVRMDKVHKKAMRKSNQVLYVNFENIIDQVKELPGGDFQREEPQKAFSILSDNIGELWSRQYKRRDPFRSYVKLTMKDDDENILWQVGQMINSIYLATANENRSNRPPVMDAPMEETEEAEEYKGDN